MIEEELFLEELLLGDEYGAYLDEEGNVARLELMGLLNRRQIMKGVRAALENELRELQQQQGKALRNGAALTARTEWRNRHERIENVRQRIELINLNLQQQEDRIADAQVRVIHALAAMLRRVVASNTQKLHEYKRKCHVNLTACDLKRAADEFSALKEVRTYLFGLYERLRLYHSIQPLEIADITLFSPLPEFEHWGASYKLSLEMARNEVN